MPNQQLPIGSIIVSILSYKDFSQDSNFNPATSIWAPADGRKVTGSKYASIQDRVPDLRGVFLRGLNNCLKGADPLDDGHKNPENKQAGEFQPDGFREHSHQIAITTVQSDFGGTGLPRYNRTTGDSQTANSGIEETRPKNVSVYFYIKINAEV